MKSLSQVFVNDQKTNVVCEGSWEDGGALRQPRSTNPRNVGRADSVDPLYIRRHSSFLLGRAG